MSVRAAVGSSMISTSKPMERALAISTICCMATVRSATFVRGSSLICSRFEEFHRLLIDGLFVENAKAIARLAPDEDILSHRKTGASG